MVDENFIAFGECDTLHDLRLADLHGAASEQVPELIAQYEARLESVGLIVRGIAHDINNLLLVIGGFGDLLKKGSKRDELVGAAANGLNEATRQMSSLVRMLSSLASKRTMTVEPIDVNAVLASMDQTIAHLLGEGVTVEVRGDPAGGAVRAVRGQLERVLLNLVLNAREAMGCKGKLTIESRSVCIDDNDYVMLTVRDNGCGMTADTAKRIYDPQFTTKKISDCGHGLTTVRRIVHDCGGEILVDSELGKGTTFEILLPRVQDASVEV